MVLKDLPVVGRSGCLLIREGTAVCPKCGYLYGGKFKGQRCLSCYKIAKLSNGRAWRLRHPDRVSTREYYRAHPGKRREEYTKNYPKRMLRAASTRAKQHGLPFAITPLDIHIPGSCPVLGIPLQVSIDKPSGTSPSIDRIVPERGYVPGNVIVVSNRANILRRDATVPELFKIATFYWRLLNPNPSPEQSRLLTEIERTLLVDQPQAKG